MIQYDSSIEQEANNLLESMVANGVTQTSIGSVKWLLWRNQPSKQSTCIKMGRFAEKFFMLFVDRASGFSNMPSGLIAGIGKGGKKKDVDFLFKSDIKKKIYYSELKGNIDLDTEKLPATLNKINHIEKWCKSQYPDYQVEASLFNWAVYDEEDCPHKSKLQVAKNSKVNVMFPRDLFDLLGVDIERKEYYDIFLRFGKKLMENN